MQYIIQAQDLLARVNVFFLPVDKGVVMADLCPTDEAQPERGSRSSAGQRGISSVAAAVCLGEERASATCAPADPLQSAGGRALVRAVPAKCEG